jgi:mannose-6-phosphate isomerase-like protein (cupin superfamily)
MRLVNVKRVAASALFLFIVTSAAAAQSASGSQSPAGSRPTTSVAARHEPSTAARPFVVLSAQSLADLETKLSAGDKTEDLIGGEGVQLRVAVQHEKGKADAAAELHDASDDVYYVLEGGATLTLGGRLDSPREASPGEWRAAHIVGGQTFEVKKGDVVIVPRGTPHQRSTADKDFTMLLIKVFAEPQRAPAAPPKSEAKPKEGRP